ncbi:MAG: RNA polymerase sigma factor [Gemmatimonadaceae bacterium]
MTDENSGPGGRRRRGLVPQPRRVPLPIATDDEAAFAEVYAREFPRFLPLARRVVGESAKDAMQETFRRLLMRVRKDGMPDKPASMVYVILRGVMHSMVRKWEAEDRLVDMWWRDITSNAPTWMSPAAELERRELMNTLHPLIAALPARERELWVKVNQEALSYKAAASQEGIEAGTARTLVSRANHRLREGLRAAGYERRGTA